MAGSTCCFLSRIQVSQEKSKVVWYFHLLKIVSQSVVIHTVKGFIILNEAEVGFFLEFLCLSYDLISSVAQSYPTLCNPTDGSTPGFPVRHQLLEFTHTRVH